MRRLTILYSLLGSFCLAFAMSGGTVVRSKSNISNNRMAPSAYVVVRPVFLVPDPKHMASVSVDQKKFYFDPSEILIDLSGVDLTTVRVQPDPYGHFVVAFSLKKTIAAMRIGVFLDGKLVAAPLLKSPFDMMIVQNSMSQAEANKVADRIRRGGAE